MNDPKTVKLSDFVYLLNTFKKCVHDRKKNFTLHSIMPRACEILSKVTEQCSMVFRNKNDQVYHM